MCFRAILLFALAGCSSQTARAPAADTPESETRDTSSAEEECEAIAGQIYSSDPELTGDVVAKLAATCPEVECACHAAGVAYRDAIGVKADPQKAVGLFDAGCEREDWSSCNEAAFLYEGKSGVPADHPKMKKYWELGCEHEPMYCQNLAFVYVEGIGTAVDLAKAEALIRHACDTWRPSCVTLANFLKHRAGKPEEAQKVLATVCKEDASLCDGEW